MRLLCGYCVVIVWLLCGASGEAIMGRRKAPKGERGKVKTENGKRKTNHTETQQGRKRLRPC